MADNSSDRIQPVMAMRFATLPGAHLMLEIECLPDAAALRDGRRTLQRFSLPLIGAELMISSALQAVIDTQQRQAREAGHA
jgi:hypothetical protein